MLNGHPTDSDPAESRRVRSLLEWAGDCLEQKGIDEHRLNAELLLARAIRCSRLQVLIQRDRSLTPDETERFTQMVSRRLTHEPIQYILGETEFMGLTLDVDRRVLIPRPETELLVERALVEIDRFAETPIRILDIGAGSGNIAIALGHRAPSASILAVDISADALEVAAHNIGRHGLTNVSLQRGDIFTDILPAGRFHLIVSNPPYVSKEEFATLQPEVKDFEPRQATTDGGDGLRFYRRIVTLAAERLFPGGTLLMEIGHNQSVAVREAVESAGLVDIMIVDDFAGIPRVIAGRCASPGRGN